MERHIGKRKPVHLDAVDARPTTTAVIDLAFAKPGTWTWRKADVGATRAFLPRAIPEPSRRLDWRDLEDKAGALPKAAER